MEGGAKRGGEQAQEKKQKTAIGEPAAEAGRLPEGLRKTIKEPQSLPWLRLLGGCCTFHRNCAVGRFEKEFSQELKPDSSLQLCGILRLRSGQAQKPRPDTKLLLNHATGVVQVSGIPGFKSGGWAHPTQYTICPDEVRHGPKTRR